MDEDSEWDDSSYGDSSDDDSNHGNDSNDLQNLDPDDFGTSDVGSWLQENRGAWTTAPAVGDWPRIRTTGSTSKKAWDLNMAIEAAFREFKIAGAPANVEQRRILRESHLTRLLRQVIYHMRDYFDENRNCSAESSMVRKTRAAALNARSKHLTGGTPEEVSKLLPAHSQVLACVFVTPNASSVWYWKEETAQAALSSDMSGESDTPSSQGAMALATKLQTEVDNINMKLRAEVNSIREQQNSDAMKLQAEDDSIREQQSNDNGEINQTLTQMLEKMNTMEIGSTAALESEIEKLAGKLGKVEGNNAELQKSIQLIHLLDEVAEKTKSDNASNTSNVPKLHQQSQNHTQALLTTATGRFSAATSISEGHRRLPTNTTHPTAPSINGNGWASVASPTTSGPTPSGARRPSAPTTPDPEAQPSGGKRPASAATSPSQPSKRSKATDDIRAKKDELLKQFLRK
ncbi:hypothetical protein FPSE5266_10378 [Fusarium pseudograminearum]|nr:hypothetical protein FPSE5266_10378 [Fusarium pseudograminearum]